MKVYIVEGWEDHGQGNGLGSWWNDSVYSSHDEALRRIEILKQSSPEYSEFQIEEFNMEILEE